MFGILGIPIRKEFGLTDVQLSWIIAVAVLNSAIWRLPAGIITDRFGGRMVMTVMLLVTAVPAFLVSTASSYTQLLIYAFLVGLAGNSLQRRNRVGQRLVAAETPGLRSGSLRASGNVGASVTKFIGPALIAAVPCRGPAGWNRPRWMALRSVPLHDHAGGHGGGDMVHDPAPRPGSRPGPRPQNARPAQADARVAVQPLLRRGIRRICRLAAWLPKYYVDVYDIDIVHAGLHRTVHLPPASLLRPVPGGWISDKVGAGR